MPLLTKRIPFSVGFRYSRQIIVHLFLLCLLTLQLIAQSGAKRPVSAQDFDSWKSLQGSQISRDGKFVAYVMHPQDGNGELVVRNVATGVEWRSPRGYRPPTRRPGGGNPAAAQAFASQRGFLRPRFSADTKFLFFIIEPIKSEILKARKAKKKAKDFPKKALGIMNLATGQITKISRVKNYKVPVDGAGFVAYLKEPIKGEKKADATAVKNKAKNAKKKTFGSELVLRRLSDGNERKFADVLAYSFSKDAKTLVYSVSSRKEESNGAYAITPQTEASPITLLSGAGKYNKFTWDEKQTQLAFLSDRDDSTASQPKFKIYHWLRSARSANEIVSFKTSGFRSGFVVSNRGALRFSYDGSRLFLSNAPLPDPKPNPNDTVPKEEKVTLDLWHWKDDYIQPIQKVRAIADRNRSYLAVWHFKEKKFTQLADKTMMNVSPSSNGLYALGTDDRSYRRMRDYDARYADYYLVNTLDGSRKLLHKKLQFRMSWSPNGKYTIFYDGKDWNSVSISSGKVTNLTSKLGVNFYREDNDRPNVASSYGIAGWTKDDKQILIYDRFDIWQVSPDGSGAKTLTRGIGRREKTIFRYIRLDPDERFIKPEQTLLLRAHNEKSRNAGFYRAKLGVAPEKLLMDAKNFGTPTKAKDADSLMFSASRFDMFPDLWVASADFKQAKKMSNGDAQRARFNWGRAELVRFKNADNVPLQGILIKPDNFDPKKKYPMLVYLYERLSQGVHNFRNPGPGTSINFSHYASNGYLIFMPDIVYKDGYPGQSALKCVLPGMQSIIDRGFVDEKAIGIQGHSWGGYQIAYMLTKTNRFKAAAPGAIVSNMTSAYGGIRWGSGLPRQFQYERTQSRIGGNLWNATSKYLENSPLFQAPKVQTPIMMIANDNDDAVPWYQGIEFYLALRRLKKEVYMFNYNGEFHGLRKRQNQKDYSRRMMEFFNHFLKGAPAPDWMKHGIRYIDRDKEKEKYRRKSVADQPQQR